MATNTFSVINLSLIPEFNALLYDNNVNNNNSDNNIKNILKLIKTECKTSDNQMYKIITYDKNILNVDLYAKYGLYRSVIINTDNKVICFAPPKSISSDEFMKKYPEKTDKIVAEEFIEGTMINVFWNDKIGLTGGWEIATKKTVGALSGFYKTKNSKTFRSMFQEAAKENNLILENLNRNYCFSFVLQHPENRIVVPFKKPQLYLVGIFHINQMDINNILVQKYNIGTFEKDLFKYTSIQFPQIYSWNEYSDLINSYASMNSSYDLLGVVIYNSETGERTKIRNPVYEQVKSLRGNQPKLQYQYISLRKEGKVKAFLDYYPENKKDFSQYRDQIHVFTNTLYMNYVSCYIKKERPLADFSQQYKTHMYHIH